MKMLRSLNSTQVSRRVFFTGGIVAGAASLLAATDASANVMVSKASVRYAETSKDGHNCGSCKLFSASSRCLFVDGSTSPEGSCWIWRSKTA